MTYRPITRSIAFMDTATPRLMWRPRLETSDVFFRFVTSPWQSEVIARRSGVPKATALRPRYRELSHPASPGSS